MNLAAWQTRLTDHFTELRASRMSPSDSQPIFALEHGLDPSEVQDLTAGICAEIQVGPPDRSHHLAWTVYAAELGYRYSGDEYWQTFEAETPGWIQHGSRDWIRDSFLSFHRKLGGARPAGAWAEHFSIICWPITHAILPRDLQRQLARILYELRHSFSAELLEAPVRLGEFIESRSWNSTSRFQNLAQENALVGQIAAALLLQDQRRGGSLIFPATLRRIAQDLDQERRAREWLRTARKFAQERARIRGLSLGTRDSSQISNRPEEARSEAAALGIEPRVLLRPADTVGLTWDVWLELPGLSQLLLRFPETREVLANSRCRVAGAEARPRPRGWLLLGDQRVTLSRWPRPEELLLAFEQPSAQLEFLLRTECLLRPGPTWLFRIASDGLAYETRSLRVRPGQRYLVLTTGPLMPDTLGHDVTINCDGIRGFAIDLPPALDTVWEKFLARIGLVQARSVEVWPAGLGAVVWDGEGHGEWLAAETPCLAIQSDFPLCELLVALVASQEPPLSLGPLQPGEPTFVELPNLPVGIHKVTVRSKSSEGDDLQSLGDLDVLLRIRSARPWSSGASTHGPLLVQLDPPRPSMEQLWEGLVDITIRGPRGRRVKPTLSLLEREGETPLHSKQLPPLSLPVSAEQWRIHFDKFFRKEDADCSFDESRVIELRLSSDELGAFSIACERAFTPLRWAVAKEGTTHVVRLIDDTGNPNAPVVSRWGFETPTQEERLGTEARFSAPQSGGMFVARSDSAEAAVLLPPLIRSLTDLRCSPEVPVETRSVDSVARLLRHSALWGRARETGFISRTRRRDVMRALALQLSRQLGGEAWASAEVQADAREGREAALLAALARKRDEAALGSALATQLSTLIPMSAARRVEVFTSLASWHLSLPPTPTGPFATRSSVVPLDWHSWLSELALRTASDPASVEQWAGPILRAGLTHLLDTPALIRTARFLVLCSSHQSGQPTTSGSLYPGWAWT